MIACVRGKPWIIGTAISVKRWINGLKELNFYNPKKV